MERLLEWTATLGVTALLARLFRDACGLINVPLDDTLPQNALKIPYLLIQPRVQHYRFW